METETAAVMPYGSANSGTDIKTHHAVKKVLETSFLVERCRWSGNAEKLAYIIRCSRLQTPVANQTAVSADGE